MRRLVGFACSATLIPLVSLAPVAQARSFVGKKLSGITFTDTEGHTIDPEHYKGSVLVLMAGIPW